MKKSSLLILLFSCTLCLSQVKNEKEERISITEFPEKARTYFNTISNDVRYMKYFKETDGSKKSFEIKFKYKKAHYSVEFDTLGNLEDLEIIIKKKHIPKKICASIFQYFESNFIKATLVKVQKQYINTSQHSDQQFILHILNQTNTIPPNFEIIAEIKTEDARELREFTFDHLGKFITSRKVTTSSYEHALY